MHFFLGPREKSQSPFQAPKILSNSNKSVGSSCRNDNMTNTCEDREETEMITLTVVNRGTSPNPPSTSTFVRNRRADIARLIQKEITKPRHKLETRDVEVQYDKTEDTSRFSRFGISSRISSAPWSSYLDKYPGSSYSSRNYGTSSSSRGSNYGFTRVSDQTSGKSTNDSTLASHRALNCQLTKEQTKDATVKTEENNSRLTRTIKNENTLIFNKGNFNQTNKKEKSPCEQTKQQMGSNTTSLANTEQDGRKKSNSTRASISPIKLPTTKDNQSDYNRRSSTPKSDASSELNCKSIDSQDSKRKNSYGRSDSASSNGKSSSSSLSSGSGSKRSGAGKTRQLTRGDSSDGSATTVSLPASRSKSSSASSLTSQSAKIKVTTPASSVNKICTAANAVNARQGNSSDARGKPPVPKVVDGNSATMKTCQKVVNKDFRKSVLNMDPNDATRKNYDRKHTKKSHRTLSVSSQDSQSEHNSEPATQTTSVGSASSKSSGKSKVPLHQRSLTRRTDSSPASSSGEKSETSNIGRSAKSKSQGVLSSGDTSDTTSNYSSDEQNDEERNKQQHVIGIRRRKRRASGSPRCETKGKLSNASSRTSVLASSADESSLTTDKPPRPPSRSRSDQSAKAEEAKSFLMRALAPVTSLFKSKEEDRSNGWMENSAEENSESGTNKSLQNSSKSATQSFSKNLSFTNSERSSADRSRSSSRLVHQSSGERPWWMDPNSDNVPDGVLVANISQDEMSQGTTVSTPLPDDSKHFDMNFFLHLYYQLLQT